MIALCALDWSRAAQALRFPRRSRVCRRGSRVLPRERRRRKSAVSSWSMRVAQRDARPNLLLERYVVVELGVVVLGRHVGRGCSARRRPTVGGRTGRRCGPGRHRPPCAALGRAAATAAVEELELLHDYGQLAPLLAVLLPRVEL